MPQVGSPGARQRTHKEACERRIQHRRGSWGRAAAMRTQPSPERSELFPDKEKASEGCTSAESEDAANHRAMCGGAVGDSDRPVQVWWAPPLRPCPAD